MKTKLGTGLQVFLNQQSQLENLYHELIDYQESYSHHENIVRIKNQVLLEKALTIFGFKIPMVAQEIPLNELYEVAVHQSTGAVIVVSQPYTISAKTITFAKSFVTHFQTFAIYMPELGVEVVNVGIVGDVVNKSFVLRSESACTPSFLFGSVECNCASQWRCTQELAAYFNANSAKNNVGFLMIHLESQNGMGMGYTPNTFAIDLGARAHLRHAAGLAVSQRYQLSTEDTFAVIGVPKDPRRAAEGAGYKITPIILDFLATHKAPILLSNNPMKIQALQNAGYMPRRLKLLGEITSNGLLEAKMRSQWLDHFDIGAEQTTFHDEFNRLIKLIEATFLEE